MKQDQMSMAASIESRVPFLDHKLVEFAAALPDEWKLSGLDDEARAARSDEGPAARIDSESAEDGLPGAVRGLDARTVERRRARRAARSALARARHHRSGCGRSLLPRSRGRTHRGRRSHSGACSTSSSGTARSSIKRGSADASRAHMIWPSASMTVASAPDHRRTRRAMRVSVFGLGYVGSVSAASFAADGHHVSASTSTPTRSPPSTRGRSPIVEPGLDDLLARAVAEGRLRATTDTSRRRARHRRVAALRRHAEPQERQPRPHLSRARLRGNRRGAQATSPTTTSSSSAARCCPARRTAS